MLKSQKVVPKGAQCKFSAPKGEGVAVDDFARAVVAYGYLSVALYREFGQSLPFAVPAWHYVEFVYG